MANNATLLSTLYNIQESYAIESTTFDVAAPRCVIDAKKRTISIPSEINSFGVQYDHRSFVVYFEIDRYVDDVDLLTQTCIIQWVNAGKTEENMGFYPVTMLDSSEDGKIVFAWEIYNESTQQPGTIQFAVRFYSMQDENSFLWSFNTLPAQSTIQDTLDVVMRPTIEIEPSILAAWNERMAQLELIARDAITIASNNAKEAEAWAHGRADYPNMALDNSKYYMEMTRAIYDDAKGSVEAEKNSVVREIIATKDDCVTEIENKTASGISALEEKKDSSIAEMETAKNLNIVEIEVKKEGVIADIEEYGTIQVTSTEPTNENVDVWINPENEEEISLPEIKDDKINTEDTWSSEKINDELSVLNRTRANSIVGEASGEMVVLNDSNKSLFGGIRLFGKTEQVTTTGAQLFDINSGANNTPFYSGDAIEQNPTSDVYVLDVPCEGNGAYTISVLETSNSEKYCRVNFMMSDNVFIQRAVLIKGISKSTITTPENCTYLQIAYDKEITKIMINKGTTALPYEPYTGGIPSPNPQYPQELVSVGGDGSIEVGVYGKNLINQLCTTTAEANMHWLPSGTYTVTRDSVERNNNWYFSATDSDGLTITTSAISFASDRSFLVSANGDWYYGAPALDSIVFTLSKACYIRIGILNALKTTYLMLNTGTTALPYEPYTKQSLTALTPNGLPGIKLGTVIPDVIANSAIHMSGVYWNEDDDQYYIADTIDFDRGVYAKRIFHETFDGSDDEGWIDNSCNIGSRYIFYADRTFIASDTTTGVSSCNSNFPIAGKGNTYTQPNLYTITYDGIFVSLNGNETLDEFKAYLAAKPMTVSCLYETPIETPLSEEELTAYRALHTNYPVTTVLNDSGAYMNVKYNIDTQTYLDVKFTEVKNEFNEKHDVLKDDVETLKTDVSNTDKTANSNKKRIEVLEDYSSTRGNAIIRTSDGETVVLSDSSDDPLRGLRVFGKTEQFTTTGAQLLDMSDAKGGTSSGITVTVNADGSLTYSGTAEHSTVNVWLRGTYTSDTSVTDKILFVLPQGTYTVSGIVLFSYTTHIGGHALHDPYTSFTLDTDTPITGIRAVTVQVTGTSVNKTVYPMLNKGDKPLPFEPYTGGIASPNPNYPQRLKTIGKSKNLFDLDSCTFGYIKNDGTLLREESNRTTDFIEIPFDVSAISISAKSAMKSYSISFWDSSKNHISTEYVYNEQTHTWSDLKNAKYVRIGVSIDNTPIGDRLPSCSIMINYGNASLPYEPYGKDDIEVGVYGKNLLTINLKKGEKITLTANKDDYQKIYTDIYADLKAGESYVFSMQTDGNIVEASKEDTVEMFLLKDLSYGIILGASKLRKEVFTVPVDGRYHLRLDVNKNGCTHSFWDIMIRKAEIADDTYEPYHEQSFTIPTPNGLPAFPLTDANLQVTEARIETYTDAYGQMWVVDEIDFERGVYVKRIDTAILPKNGWVDGGVTATFTEIYIKYPDVCELTQRVVSNFFTRKTNSRIALNPVSKCVYVRFPIELVSTFEEASEWIASHDVMIQYVLATPIETPLSEEEMAQYRALHTNYPVTTILNDSGANMEVKYAADTNNYIEQNFVPVNKYNSLITRIEALESAIVTT